MTGYNDPVPYNANLTYSGEVPPITADAAMTSTSTVALTMEQHYLRSADVASTSTSAATTSVVFGGTGSLVSASVSALAVTVSVGRAIDAVMAGTATATIDGQRRRQQVIDLALAAVADASMSIRLDSQASVNAAGVTTMRARVARTRATPLAITVAGDPVEFHSESLSIEQALGQRSTARFSVRDTPGVLRFDRGQRVEIMDAAELLWSGYVDTAQRSRAIETTDMVHSLTCIDQQYLADKRIAARSYEPGVTCGDVVQDLFDTCLIDEGVTLGAVEDGATLEQGMLINYQPVSAALDALVDASDGYVWTIDQHRVLSFHHRSSSLAPWAVDGSSILGSPVPLVTSGNPDYRNTQWILGGLGTTDPQTETRTGDGDTRAFTMSYPLAMVPTVLLNGTPQTVGIKGLEDDSTYDFGWNKGDAVVSQSSDGTKLTSSDTLTVTYQGQYAIVARVDDPTGIAGVADIEGGSGIVEHALSPANVDSTAQAFALAQARLDAYDRAGTRLQFDTDEAGLQAGQWVTVDLPALGLNGLQMLIESVSGWDRGDGHLRWSASAVDGPTTLPWQRVLGAPPELRKDDLVSVGSGTVVALVVSPRETTGWTEEIEESPMTCPLLPYTLPVILC